MSDEFDWIPAGEYSLWGVLAALTTPVSTAGKSDPSLTRLGKNLPIDPPRVRSQPFEEYSQQNNGEAGKHESGIDLMCHDLNTTQVSMICVFLGGVFALQFTECQVEYSPQHPQLESES